MSFIFIYCQIVHIRRTLQLLYSRYILYNYYFITTDFDFKRISNRTSMNTFPEVFIKNEFIGGYSDLAELSGNAKLIYLID